MSINSYSNIAKVATHLKNPNLQTGTLIIEVPADVGRAYSGYKRGGIIEGAEKFRKEIMSAIVWLFGIPVFNKLGNVLCEKLLKIPMDIDYSNGKKGVDSIKNTIEYLKNSTNENNFDTSEIKKYLSNTKIIENLKKSDTDKIIKQIKGAKQAISITSLVLNCFLMGIALPKFNQKITKDKLANEKKQTSLLKTDSFEEFKTKTQKKDMSFTGLNASNVIDTITYGINNNNTFRLISTDIPMIAGRCATARNKYEAIEIAFIDGASIYFYNFCLGHVEKFLRNIIKTPDINGKISEIIGNLDNDTLKDVLLKVEENSQNLKLNEIFNKDTQEKIYKEATFGKYGKINRFVKDSELNEIDKNVIKFLEYINQNKSKIFSNNEIDIQKLGKFIKNINKKNLLFYSIGSIVSMFGLGILVPKAGFAITKKLTGKSGFIGIEDCDDKNVKKC